MALSCAIGVPRGVLALPGVLGDLADASGAGLALLALLGGEFGGLGLCGRGSGQVRFGAVTERLIEFFGGFLLHPARDVGVCADGRFRRGMSKEHRKRFDVHSVLDAVGCEDMAQSMEWDMLTLGALEKVGELAPAACGASRFCFVERGRKHPFGIHRFLVFFEDPDDRLRDLDGSDRCFRFRRADDVFRAKRGVFPLHAELAGLKVDVFPAQSEQLATAEPRGKREEDHFVEALGFRLDQEPAHFVVAEDLDLPVLFRREFAPDRLVPVDESLFLRLVERGFDARMHRTDHRARELFFAHAVAVEVSGLHLLGVELFEIALFQMRQRDLADTGDDVLIDLILIFKFCRFGDRDLTEVAIPVVDVLTERHIRRGFDDRFLYAFPQGFEFFFGLAFGFCEDVLRDR